MKKVVRVGTVIEGETPSGAPRACDVFCSVEITEDGRLSISGVVGPRANGDCWGSAGQIEMSIKAHEITPATGWTVGSVAKFFKTWRAWHLNDMHAGCSHQRANWDLEKKLSVVEYKLNSDASDQQTEIKKIANARLLKGETVKLTPDEMEVLALPYFLKGAPDADSSGSGRYEVYKQDIKAAGWVSQDEHPEGLLSKPCDVCGYKYGSAWLKEELPAEVIEFLKALPDTDKTPSWV